MGKWTQVCRLRECHSVRLFEFRMSCCTCNATRRTERNSYEIQTCLNFVFSFEFRTVVESWLNFECLLETYRLLQLECHSSSLSNFNLIGFFSKEDGKRDLENRSKIEIQE